VGPASFWRIFTSPGAIEGALHERREPVTGTGTIGFECSNLGEDVHAIAAAIEKHGGKVTHQPFVIETVGTLIMFGDTEGNVAGAMQYLKQAR
jgi:predicted enzyme related to lactoylglutathione lyase